MKLSPLHCIKFPSRQSSDSAAFLIGTEKKDEAWRVVSTSFELHFYSITNEERSTSKFSVELVLLLLVINRMQERNEQTLQVSPARIYKRESSMIQFRQVPLPS